MDTILGIFAQLGVDQTVFAQFIIAIIVFIGCKFFFLSKMRLILQTREELTTGLEEESEKLTQRAQEASEKFQNQVESVYQNNQEKFNQKKSDLAAVESSELSKADKEIEEMSQGIRSETQGFLDTKKQELMSQVKELSDELTTKFVK